jgi:hypothetical protein
MGDAPDNLAISDWTSQSVFTGTLTRTRGYSAVVRVDALVGSRDGTPASAGTVGLFRIMAMDDRQPDPVHVANLLRSLLDGRDDAAMLNCCWGDACVGMVHRADPEHVVSVFVLTPQRAREIAKVSA